jgi:UDP-N-acetylglucosamine:LPS N-acetylglucosamine transferase
MILQIPKIIYRIYAEHKALQNIITNYKIDAVISDNRFGLYSSKIPCVFITHQLFIKTPFLSTLIFSMNHFFIKKYNTCWVPDCNNTESLSGELSSTKWQIKTPIQRIGFLSRFKQPIAFDGVKRKSILCILSGPEPQRSMLMKMIIQQVSNANYTCTIIGAKSGSLLHHTENIQCMPVADAIQMERLLATHQYIITRSGYSSLMDFAVIKRTAILIPTPGQSEQEYLGKLMQEKQMHYSCQQQLFNLEVAIKAIDEGNWKTINVTKNNNLQNAILELGNGIISK